MDHTFKCLLDQAQAPHLCTHRHSVLQAYIFIIAHTYIFIIASILIYHVSYCTPILIHWEVKTILANMLQIYSLLHAYKYTQITRFFEFLKAINARHETTHTHMHTHIRTPSFTHKHTHVIERQRERERKRVNPLKKRSKSNVNYRERERER